MARKQHKLVILDLHAVWCHWCHVMEHKTYADAKVKRFVGEHFVAIAVDQDSRPDLASRYEDYGWPATIVFDAQGRELAKFRGYIEAGDLLETLQNLVQNPNAEVDKQDSSGTPAVASVANANGLTPTNEQALRAQVIDFYDPADHGFGQHNKFLQAEPTEYTLWGAYRGDGDDKTRAQQTMQSGKKLLDPVWGGVYQYSVEGWNTPHFEKVMSMQTANITLYSMAASIFPETASDYLAVARSVAHYLQTFLRAPDGAFYTSQDADVRPGEQAAAYFALNDPNRRQQGMPKIDKHVYARDNGWAIAALAALYAAGGDTEALSAAQAAAAAMVAQRSLPKGVGGYSHDAKDTAGPYLADTLAMGQAHWALYVATGDRKALQRATDAATFIQKTFNAPMGGGFLTAKATPGGVLPPVQEAGKNLALARWTQAMYEATGAAAMAAIRDAAMAVPAATDDQPGLAASLLLLNAAITQPPLHLCIVGSKKDAAALALYRAALRYPEPHKRLEWWDSSEGPLPRADVQFPTLPHAAAFICTGTRCSKPVTDAQALAATIAKLTAPPAAPKP